MEPNELDVRLIRLNGEQAATYWPVLSAGFAKTLEPSPTPSNVILNNLLLGVVNRTYDCWMVQVPRDGKSKQAVGMITTTRHDPITGQRFMLIHSLFSRLTLEPAEWKEVYRLLRAVAKKNACSKIVAYSKNPRMLNIIHAVGGATDVRAVELEV